MSVALWIKYGLIFVAVIAGVALIVVALSRFRNPPQAVGKRDEQLGLFPFGDDEGGGRV